MSAPLFGGAAVNDRPGGLRLAAGAVVLVMMAASAAYSANVEGFRDRYAPPATRLVEREARAVAVPDEVAAPARDLTSRSQPWWQPLASLSGEGNSTTKAFTVDPGALQWRAHWECTTGSFKMTPTRSGGRAPRSLADSATCPAKGTGFSVRTGPHSLRIEASGPWTVTIEQQVDVPLIEPPLPEMVAPESKVVATATMYDVDRVGKGTARVHQLADGRQVLRLEDFFVSINSDLEIWLSEVERPTTTPEATAAPHVQVSFLKATTGAMNYPLPDGVDLSKFRSIVIWCELTSNAYAAAVIER